MINWRLPAADTYFAPMLKADPRGFQIDHLERALAHCRRWRTAVDGGAHIGTWSVAMAQRFERVIAFEPAPDTYECLRQNAAGFANIYPQRRALADRVLQVRVKDDPTRAGNTGARFVEIAAFGDLGAVQAIPLDQCQREDVDFIKLDLEGYELPALAGACLTVMRCRPVIMIEVKPLRGHDPMAAVNWLSAHGYREAERVRRDVIFVPE